MTYWYSGRLSPAITIRACYQHSGVKRCVPLLLRVKRAGEVCKSVTFTPFSAQLYVAECSAVSLARFAYFSSTTEKITVPVRSGIRFRGNRKSEPVSLFRPGIPTRLWRLPRALCELSVELELHLPLEAGAKDDVVREHNAKFPLRMQTFGRTAHRLQKHTAAEEGLPERQR